MGLDLPEGAWTVTFTVPASVPRGRVDADVCAYIWHVPGDHDLSRWELKIGAGNAHGLGGSGAAPSWPPGAEYGEYDRPVRRGGPRISGVLVPPRGPSEIPRVLGDLESAHPDLSYDRSAVTCTGNPGRLITPTRKKRLIGWLTGQPA